MDHQLTVTRNQDRFVTWTSDILIYVLVLNLFAQFYDAIIITSFLISLFTAALLTAILNVMISLRFLAGRSIEREGQPLTRVLAFAAKFAILFVTRLLILVAVSLIFGDAVQLGGSFDVLVLILTMMAARAIADKIYVMLGDT